MDKKLAYSYIVIMGILSGFVIFSGRFFLDRGLSLLEVGFLPNLVALLVLAPLLFWMPMKRKLLWWYVLYGVIGCALVLAQFSPLVFGVPVALLVLLLYTQPLWTLLINTFFLGQRGKPACSHEVRRAVFFASLLARSYAYIQNVSSVQVKL